MANNTFWVLVILGRTTFKQTYIAIDKKIIT